MSFAVIRDAFLLPEKNLSFSRMIVLCNMFDNQSGLRSMSGNKFIKN